MADYKGDNCISSFGISFAYLFQQGALHKDRIVMRYALFLFSLMSFLLSGVLAQADATSTYTYETTYMSTDAGTVTATTVSLEDYHARGTTHLVLPKALFQAGGILDPQKLATGNEIRVCADNVEIADWRSDITPVFRGNIDFRMQGSNVSPEAYWGSIKITYFRESPVGAFDVRVAMSQVRDCSVVVPQLVGTLQVEANMALAPAPMRAAPVQVYFEPRPMRVADPSTGTGEGVPVEEPVGVLAPGAEPRPTVTGVGSDTPTGTGTGVGSDPGTPAGTPGEIPRARTDGARPVSGLEIARPAEGSAENAEVNPSTEGVSRDVKSVNEVSGAFNPNYISGGSKCSLGVAGAGPWDLSMLLVLLGAGLGFARRRK